MPRLQILQHKSYHPYLEKNKQRVREDEARAREEELAIEQKRINNEAENRLNLLRRRANSPTFQEDDNLPSTSAHRDDRVSSLLERHHKQKAREERKERKQKERLDFDFPSETMRRNKGKEREQSNHDDIDWTQDGHINLFADVERENAARDPSTTVAELAKVKKDQEKDPFTVYLARPDRETKPWYTDKEMRQFKDRELGEEAEGRRARDRRKDARSKIRNDPLTDINSQLSSHPSKTSHRRVSSHNPPPPDPQTARKAREQSERQRALALIAKSKQTIGSAWDSTPSTVSGGGTWAEDFERAKDKAGRRFYQSRY
ncbi:uncharacterized protein L203_100547 [Cryptococcus depauperatus CBS 7841]|uniref:CBF1-interacting co-repressor CIR N-terminal domain-containing protein n=1 Tax=Cryptococcus depauperatus CBS 7841 TaxID=1295531 RepID=A0AAJ8JND8_9TREE